MIENDVRIATIIDCEGWVTLQKVSGSRGVGLVLTLGVGNTNHKLTDWLKQTYGGSVYMTKRDSFKHKDYYTWRIHGTKARDILASALPFMLMKQEQAKLAVHFQDTMHSKDTYNEPCTQKYIDYMHSLKAQMNQLNRKGKAVSPATTERDNTELCEATV